MLERVDVVKSTSSDNSRRGINDACLAGCVKVGTWPPEHKIYEPSRCGALPSRIESYV